MLLSQSILPDVVWFCCVAFCRMPDLRRDENPSVQYTQVVVEDEEVTVLEMGSGRILGSTFNLANAALGAGMLSFPYAMNKAGMVGVVLLTFALTGFAWGTLEILARSAEKYKARSYQDMVLKAFGRKLSIMINVCIGIYCFGACIAYLIVMGDQLEPLFQSISKHSFFTQRAPIIVSFAVVLILPLCLLRRISALSYSSFLATAAVVYLCLVVMVLGLIGTHDSNGNPTPSLIHNPHAALENIMPFHWDATALQAIPIICFAFQCHLSCIPIYAELRDRRVATMRKVIGLTLLLCIIVYCITAFFGIITFGTATVSDVLLNYSSSAPSIIAARMAIAVVGVCSYPLLQFVGRLALSDMFEFLFPAFFAPQRPPATGLHLEDQLIPAVAPPDGSITICNSGPLMLLTGVFFVTTTTLGAVIKDINVVIGFTGSTIAVFVMFIFPGILSLKKLGAAPKAKGDRRAGYFYIVFGVVVCIISLSVSVWSDVTGTG